MDHVRRSEEWGVRASGEVDWTGVIAFQDGIVAKKVQGLTGLIASRGIGVTPSTALVFCQVTAVIAVIPCTPQRANAFRSAWMPAPPPESEPAMDSTRGTRCESLEALICRRG